MWSGENRSTALFRQRSRLVIYSRRWMYLRRHRTASSRGFGRWISRIHSWTLQGAPGGFAPSPHRHHDIQIIRRRLLSSGASGRHSSGRPRRTQKQVPRGRADFAIFVGLRSPRDASTGGTLQGPETVCLRSKSNLISSICKARSLESAMVRLCRMGSVNEAHFRVNTFWNLYFL